MKIVDLSHQLTPGKEEYLLDLKTYSIEELLPQYNRRPEDWYILQEVHFNAHVGTHIESPYHHRKDGHNISDIPIERLIGSAVKLDFTHKQPNEVISKDELCQAAAPYNLKDTIVFLHLGRDKFYHDPDLGHQRQYPSEEAVTWLVEQEIACLAVDATGIEVKGLNYQPNHSILFSKNIPLVENVVHLDQLPDPEFGVAILPLNIKGMESCPVRVIAFLDYEVR
ncbi:MAG: cyclase family protein [bacterium]|nr:cyclase family protein [bacterium]